MPKLTLNIIGSGRLATHLAMAMRPFTNIQSVYSRTRHHAHQLQTLCEAAEATDHLHSLPPAHLTFIATSDDSISELANALALSPHFKPKQHYVHFSGALTSQVLQPLQTLGSYVASLHPFRPFTPYDSTTPHHQAFQHCYCFVEGDSPTTTLLHELFQRCEAIVTPISPSQKNNCHLAGVLASNHLITLAAFAESLLRDTELPPQQRQQAIQDLMQHTQQNMAHHTSFQAALTGPVARGDLHTIQQHVHGLTDPVQKDLYRLLVLETLKLTTLPEALKTKIKCLF